MKPMLIYSGANPELWLCELLDGAWKPVSGTFPITMPPEWREAIHEAERKREADASLVLDFS